MNIENLQNHTLPITTGKRLRQARENIGLSQQTVAKLLCLKISTIREIEDDLFNPNIATIFQRGYIRSYARLVRISEKEVLPILKHQEDVKISKTVLNNKKNEKFLAKIISVIFLILINIACIWWWQNYRSHKNNININNQTSSKVMQEKNIPKSSANNNISIYENKINKILSNNKSEISTFKLSQPKLDNVIDLNLNELAMDFTDECWLELLDAKGQKIFSGIQHRGNRLNFAEQAPYKLWIGAPAAVQVKYNGKPVDLSRFISTNKIARITLNAQ